MRILVSTVCFPPAWKGGGSARTIGNLSRGLAAAGAEVRVVTTSAFMDRDEIPDRERVEDGMRITTLPVPPWAGAVGNRFGFAPSFPSRLVESMRGADVCLAQGVWTFPLAVTSRACRRRRLPYVVKASGSLERRSLAEKAAKKRLYYGLVERFALRNAEAFVFSSDAERRRSATVTAGHASIVVPNPLEERPRRRPPSGWLRDRYGFPPDALIVGMSGRIHPRKGFDLLVPALARIDSRICCLAFGPDEGGFAESVVRSAVAHGVADRFRMVGHLGGDELQDTYAGLDLLVLPSHGESFGNVVLEALAQGTEVLVAAEVPLATYVDSHGFGRVVHTPAVEAWAEALSDWASRPRDFDAERAAASVRRDFDRVVIGRRLLDELRELVG